MQNSIDKKGNNDKTQVLFYRSGGIFMDSTCDYSKKFLLTKNEYKFYQMLRRYIAKGTKIEAYSNEYIQTAQNWNQKII